MLLGNVAYVENDPGGRGKVSKGVQYLVVEGNGTSGGERTMEYTDVVPPPTPPHPTPPTLWTPRTTFPVLLLKPRTDQRGRTPLGEHRQSSQLAQASQHSLSTSTYEVR